MTLVKTETTETNNIIRKTIKTTCLQVLKSLLEEHIKEGWHAVDKVKSFYQEECNPFYEISLFKNKNIIKMTSEEFKEHVENLGLMYEANQEKKSDDIERNIRKSEVIAALFNDIRRLEDEIERVSDENIHKQIDANSVLQTIKTVQERVEALEKAITFLYQKRKDV